MRIAPGGGDSFDIVSSGPSGGEPVLLLQGFPDGELEYRYALPRLAQAGYRAIAAVRRASSASGAAVAAAPHDGDPWLDASRQVLGIADALSLERFHVAGGELAWRVAREAPARVLSVATTSSVQAEALAQHEAIVCPSSGQ